MAQVNINGLRRKIEVDPTDLRYMLTTVGVGYSLAPLPLSRLVGTAGERQEEGRADSFRRLKPELTSGYPGLHQSPGVPCHRGNDWCATAGSEGRGRGP